MRETGLSDVRFSSSVASLDCGGIDKLGRSRLLAKQIKTTPNANCAFEVVLFVRSLLSSR
jgi:hypothetical protein